MRLLAELRAELRVAIPALAHLPLAIARDVWQWCVTEPACRFANLTNEDPDA